MSLSFAVMTNSEGFTRTYFLPRIKSEILIPLFMKGNTVTFSSEKKRQIVLR